MGLEEVLNSPTLIVFGVFLLILFTYTINLNSRLRRIEDYLAEKKEDPPKEEQKKKEKK